MADSWSSDDEDRITGLRSAEKTRRRRGKKHVSPHCVVRYKVPGKISVLGRIVFFNSSELVAELCTVYNTHGADKLLYYIQQRFERSRRDTAAVTHCRGEDREVIRMVSSYHCAYLLTQDKRCTIQIYDLLRNTYNLNVTYVDVVTSQIQNVLFSYTMDDNNYSKAHKHLQAALLVLQNVAPGACTAIVYDNLAHMYEQLAYLMPHRNTSHLHSALHLYNVAREHYRCEGERTGDWEEVNSEITQITLCMINIKLMMPNYHSNTSLYGHLYHSSLVEDSDRRCTVTDADISAAEYMWDHITRPIAIPTVNINDLACVIYLYLRKSQIEKQGREYTLALKACVTAMSWYNVLHDSINPAITTQIGCVLLDLFQEIHEKVAGAGTDVLHQEEEEVVHSAECYIDERVLCYTRTEEKEDTTMMYSDLSDTSFDLSSESDENIGHKQVEKRTPSFAQTSSSSLKKDAFITEESSFHQIIADSDKRLITEPPYSNESISTEDEVPEPEIYIDWSTVDKFLQYMEYDIDSSDEYSDCTDSDGDAAGCEDDQVTDNEDPQATEHSEDFSVCNQLLLDISDEILVHNDQSTDILKFTNTEKNFTTTDSKSHDNVTTPDYVFLKDTKDTGSELTTQAATDMTLSSETCTGSHVLTSEQSATDHEREYTSVSCQAKDEDNIASPVTREGQHDTESSRCQSKYYSAQENISTSGYQPTDSDTSGQEDNTCDNGRPINQVGSDIKPPALQEVIYDPSVDDVTDSSGLDESSPNDDSQDTEVMDGY